MRKLGALVLTGLLVFVVLAGVGCSKKAAQVAGSGKSNAVMVDSTKVKTGTLTINNTANGTLEALHSADIVAKSTGKVAGISVDVGSSVSEGQILVSLEADDLAAALRLNEAGVETARINYDLAQKKYDQGKQLLEAGALSQWEFDNDYQGAWGKARASLDSAQASADQTQAKYNDAFIKSPLNGVVTARNINVGEQASSSSTLITVNNLDKVTITVNVLEDQVNRLQVGQGVSVKVSAVSDVPFTGTITNIALAASSSTKAFPIKVQIDNPDHQLKPGMFADVTFAVTGKTGLLVPTTAVTAYNGSHKLFLIKDETARDTSVVTGDSDAQNTLIISGVNEGDEVIINGTDAALKEGAAVQRR